MHSSSPPICATCPAHLIHHDLIILIITGEECCYEAPHYAILMSIYPNNQSKTEAVLNISYQAYFYGEDC
jgi:hypothetical protein